MSFIIIIGVIVLNTIFYVNFCFIKKENYNNNV